ncbi:uncharacterized protein I303_102733 [Kwoniella dejecticola CBS 10117]|uniref:Uncharacterized protein n=1 Tax=Kwoniella dejecticola CBS 10117 TaxID=1296121 RepID=A0A1A6A9K6_9TREE|nr:uncharacterized protein I303_02748 [Kwoniella dejecticola CBS 10117]OBR86734.1 hypothetical protein I303_02748 [Kwoniella dejecticola CBS 10117]
MDLRNNSSPDWYPRPRSTRSQSANPSRSSAATADRQDQGQRYADNETTYRPSLGPRGYTDLYQTYAAELHMADHPVPGYYGQGAASTHDNRWYPRLRESVGQEHVGYQAAHHPRRPRHLHQDSAAHAPPHRYDPDGHRPRFPTSDDLYASHRSSPTPSALHTGTYSPRRPYSVVSWENQRARAQTRFNSDPRPRAGEARRPSPRYAPSPSITIEAASDSAANDVRNTSSGSGTVSPRREQGQEHRDTDYTTRRRHLSVQDVAGQQFQPSSRLRGLGSEHEDCVAGSGRGRGRSPVRGNEGDDFYHSRSPSTFPGDNGPQPGRRHDRPRPRSSGRTSTRTSTSASRTRGTRGTQRAYPFFDENTGDFAGMTFNLLHGKTMRINDIPPSWDYAGIDYDEGPDEDQITLHIRLIDRSSLVDSGIQPPASIRSIQITRTPDEGDPENGSYSVTLSGRMRNAHNINTNASTEDTSDNGDNNNQEAFTSAPPNALSRDDLGMMPTHRRGSMQVNVDPRDLSNRDGATRASAQPLSSNMFPRSSIYNPRLSRTPGSTRIDNSLDGRRPYMRSRSTDQPHQYIGRGHESDYA